MFFCVHRSSEHTTKGVRVCDCVGEYSRWGGSLLCGVFMVECMSSEGRTSRCWCVYGCLWTCTSVYAPTRTVRVPSTTPLFNHDPSVDRPFHVCLSSLPYFPLDLRVGPDREGLKREVPPLPTPTPPLPTSSAGRPPPRLPPRFSGPNGSTISDCRKAREQREGGGKGREEGRGSRG